MLDYLVPLIVANVKSRLENWKTLLEDTDSVFWCFLLIVGVICDFFLCLYVDLKPVQQKLQERLNPVVSKSSTQTQAERLSDSREQLGKCFL